MSRPRYPIDFTMIVHKDKFSDVRETLRDSCTRSGFTILEADPHLRDIVAEVCVGTSRGSIWLREAISGWNYHTVTLLLFGHVKQRNWSDQDFAIGERLLNAIVTSIQPEYVSGADSWMQEALMDHSFYEPTNYPTEMPPYLGWLTAVPEDSSFATEVLEVSKELGLSTITSGGYLWLRLTDSPEDCSEDHVLVASRTLRRLRGL
jgi:hypothetical protein